MSSRRRTKAAGADVVVDEFSSLSGHTVQCGRLACCTAFMTMRPRQTTGESLFALGAMDDQSRVDVGSVSCVQKSTRPWLCVDTSGGFRGSIYRAVDSSTWKRSKRNGADVVSSRISIVNCSLARRRRQLRGVSARRLTFKPLFGFSVEVPKGLARNPVSEQRLTGSGTRLSIDNVRLVSAACPSLLQDLA